MNIKKIQLQHNVYDPKLKWLLLSIRYGIHPTYMRCTEFK